MRVSIGDAAGVPEKELSDHVRVVVLSHPLYFSILEEYRGVLHTLSKHAGYMKLV